jgi:probable phosphoglycerate mutase
VAKIILIRHGHVEGIEPARFRGRRDVALTRLGEAQAEAVARHVAAHWKPDAIYASPLLRCVATAERIARACGLRAETLDPLTDIDYGACEFGSHDEVRDSNPALFAAWLANPHLVRFPGGESLPDVAARAADALRLMLARGAGDCLVAVAHDSVNRVLLLQLLDMPLSHYWRLQQSPCCINEIDVTDGRVLVRSINERQHLDGIAA